MKFSKPGYSFTHPSNSFKESWRMALHDPLFLIVMVVVWGIIAFEYYMRYF